MRFFVFVILCLMVSSAFCQKARIGGLPQSTMVVTNETDGAAMVAIAVLTTNTVKVADTNGWETGAHKAWLTNETDAAALNALATNRVTRWYDPELPTRWAEWDGGTNIVIYKVVSNGVNITVSGSIGADGVYTPTGLGEGYLFIGPSPYVITLDTGRVYLRNSDTPMDLAGSDNLVAPYGPWDVGAETLPIVSSFSSFNLTTNVEWRYILPTNAIPPELANLDNLQGWLNNLYAMKSVVDGHITDGTHTNVTLAGTVTIGGVARTDWPEGGTASPTSVAALITASPTNITVVSTQHVYEVTATGAGAVSLDWSGLSLDGSTRAEVLLRLHVSEWGGTNVTFAPSLTFDATPEILVTGIWEFAASTIDGVTTRVRQTWPECCGWQPVVITSSGESLIVGTYWQMPVSATNYVYWQAVNRTGLVRMELGIVNNNVVDVDLYSSYAGAGNTTFSELDVFQSKTLSFPLNSGGQYTVSIAVPQAVYPNRGVKIWVAPVGEPVRIHNLKCRDFTANERAAYEAGWRP